MGEEGRGEGKGRENSFIRRDRHHFHPWRRQYVNLFAIKFHILLANI